MVKAFIVSMESLILLCAGDGLSMEVQADPIQGVCSLFLFDGPAYLVEKIQVAASGHVPLAEEKGSVPSIK